MADESIQSTRIDREDIRLKLGEITGWEVNHGQTKTQTGTSASQITDTDLYSSALDQRIRRRDVVIQTTSGHAARGQRRWVTATVTSSGVVAVSPAFGTVWANGDNYELWDGDAAHPNVIDQCIDLSLEAAWYWRPTPLTMLRGGDIGDELTITDDDLLEFGTVIWTGDGNIALTLQELDMPDEYTRRVARLVATATDGGIESNVIDVDPTNRPTWYIQALTRSMGTVAGAAAGTGNGSEIKVMDKTNAAEITPSTALSTVSRGWELLESSFTLPATCYQIAIQQNVETSGEVGEFAWIQLANDQQTTFSLPRRIRNKRFVGPVFVRTGTRYGEFRRVPWRGSIERRDAVGRGVTLELNPAPGQNSVWFYEKVAFPKLTTTPPAVTDDDNETWCPMEWVVAGALVEIYKFLRHRDKKEFPERWLEELADAQAELSAIQEDYGSEKLLTEDSHKPIGSAILPT